MTASAKFMHVGWSLGNYCPFSCRQCYSKPIRDSDYVLTMPFIDKLSFELADIGVKHITLGGNEPFFTSGPKSSDSRLPYIISQLCERGVKAHLVSSGPSVKALARDDPHVFGRLASVTLSLDSPYKEEHDNNRGAKLFDMVMECATTVSDHGVPLMLLYCAMDWNFDGARIVAFLDLASRTRAYPRINPGKPVLRDGQITRLLDETNFWGGFEIVTKEWPTQVVTEPWLRRAFGLINCDPCCGSSTFRICSADSTGSIALSACTYVHTLKIGNLVRDSLAELIQQLEGPGCGDCLARRDLPHWPLGAHGDPKYIPDWSDRRMVPNDLDGAFENYLCTWVGARG